ncbi:MAG: RadC family protein [Methanomicrobiales archaeon]
MPPFRTIPPIDRPREKIARLGAQALSDTELIAAIIGGGTKGRDVLQIATDVLRSNGGNPSALTYDDLQAISGMGDARSCQLLAAFELGRRHLVGTRQTVTSPEDVLPILEGIRTKKQEYFMCITLNGAGEIIEPRVITVGLVNFSPVHPREVFADAIAERATSVVLAHNHPSGNPEPSSQDLEITRQLVEAGDLLGIRVLDHLIVTRQSHLSLKARGLL